MDQKMMVSVITALVLAVFTTLIGQQCSGTMEWGTETGSVRRRGVAQG